MAGDFGFSLAKQAIKGGSYQISWEITNNAEVVYMYINFMEGVATPQR